MEKNKKQILKNLKNNERGSITILVLTTMMVVVGVILFAYMLMMNKSSSQERELDKIQEEYNQTDDMLSQAYEELKTNWNEEKGINDPMIGENMELVEWDEVNKIWIPDDDASSVQYIPASGTEDNNASQWANARITINGIESYFVWIPRYEYKINSDKTISIKFIPTSQTIPDTGYIIHSAFTSKVENGGWTEELPGFWVGKYEVAHSDATSSIIGTSQVIKVQPGVKSWNNVTIGNIYTYANAFNTKLNSHMLKNSEWGAVAYLAHSQYGRNGTNIAINDNNNHITAYSGDIEASMLQSTTGNVYGVYDLVGCSWEYVASYYNGSNTLTNGSTFAQYGGNSTKDVMAYSGTNVNSDYKIGDATYETTWQYNNFVNTTEPFFIRGGSMEMETSGVYAAGIFAYGRTNGGTQDNFSFRIALTII